MKSIFSVLLVAMVIGFSGCTGASEEDQTIYDQNQQNLPEDNQLPLGSVEYDLADYLYNALVYTPADESSKVISQNVYSFDANGNEVARFTYEKSYNPNIGVSINEFKYDDILGRDVHTERDIIGDYEITVVSDLSDGTTRRQNLKRKVRINEDLTYADSAMQCTLREHYDILDTRDINVLNIPEDLYSIYSDVLRIQCVGANNYIADSYIKKGLGQVVSVTSDNGVISYTVLDQDSWQIIGQ